MLVFVFVFVGAVPGTKEVGVLSEDFTFTLQI